LNRSKEKEGKKSSYKSIARNNAQRSHGTVSLSNIYDVNPPIIHLNQLKELI
jgi:hypothetical protein